MKKEESLEELLSELKDSLENEAKIDQDYLKKTLQNVEEAKKMADKIHEKARSKVWPLF